MRLFILSLGACTLALGAVFAQNSGESESGPQLPVGQTNKQFEFPDYENGTLKATFFATEATGITLNRADAKNVKIQVYNNGSVTTTITSPDADIYLLHEKKMRTKNTVQIERDDLTATSQDCDFDLNTKKYVLRTNVKVLLKHFDIGGSSANNTNTATSPKPAAAIPAPTPAPSHPAQTTDLLQDSPGSYANTNSDSAPIPPSSYKIK
jgi:hypothetical protein